MIKGIATTGSSGIFLEATTSKKGRTLMGIFSSIGKAVFGPSDKELMEESMEASSRYSSVPGRPSYIHETDAQTQDEKTIVRTHNELIARGYHWDGRQWIREDDDE